jgi:hypothetical protein
VREEVMTTEVEREVWTPEAALAVARFVRPKLSPEDFARFWALVQRWIDWGDGNPRANGHGYT